MKRIALCALSIASLIHAMNAETDLPILGLAHVAFQVSDLESSTQQYRSYYRFETAFSTNAENPTQYLKINDNQFIKLVEVPDETDENRLIEIAFQVSNLDTTVRLLAERGLQPTNIHVASDGSNASSITDPNGHKLLFIEYGPESMQTKTRGKHLGASRVSDRLQHVGITIRDEAAANALYGDALGFQETWRGSRKDGGPDAWVNMQMPGERGDYIEYVLIGESEPTRAQLGSMHHICLLADDIQKVHQRLLENGLPDLARHKPMIGRSDRWLLNVHDLDGTRTEFMEEALASR